MNKSLQVYYAACDIVANEFIKHVFEDDTAMVDGDYNFWIADDIGGILAAGDLFFDLESMIDYLKYKYTPQEIMKHYDQLLEAGFDSKLSVDIKEALKYIRQNKPIPII